jgi:hypothetical protein
VTTRWARFARGWLAALFSTLVAAGSHTVAGGHSPGVLALLVALAFAGVTCVALTGKAMSLPRLSAAVALSQLAFHTVFSSIAAGGQSAAGHTAAAAQHVHAAATPLVVGDVASAGHHTDGWMWLGHAVAAVLTIVALRHGEGAFWRLRSIALLFVRTVFAVVPVPVPVRPAAPRPVEGGHLFVPRFCAFVRSSLGLRGPPAGAVA